MYKSLNAPALYMFVTTQLIITHTNVFYISPLDLHLYIPLPHYSHMLWCNLPSPAGGGGQDVDPSGSLSVTWWSEIT